MPEPRIFFSEDTMQEIHIIGESTAVCWNLKKVTETGRISLVRNSAQPPYIDFLRLRRGTEQEWVDDDSPVEGGLLLKQAIVLQSELSAAVEYLKEQAK